jgi:hypothetical protein
MLCGQRNALAGPSGVTGGGLTDESDEVVDLAQLKEVRHRLDAVRS